MATKERPPYVRFERRAVEDRTASQLAGQYVAKDVDFVIITPAGTKDEIVKEVAPWLAQAKQQVREMRLDPDHEEFFLKSYEGFKRGEEMPMQGTPIKGWNVISPAQQTNCIAANIRTVEDLAGATAEGVGRIGMGGVELKQKADAWLKASVSLGTVVMENSGLKIRVATLEGAVRDLEEKNGKLAAENQLLKAKLPQPAKV